VKKIQLIHRRTGVYYHYQFIYLFKLTNTEKPASRGKPEAQTRNLANARANTARRFLSSGRKWKSRDWWKEERRRLAGNRILEQADRWSLLERTAQLYANRQVRQIKRLPNRIVCGKTPAYPQQQMCRSHFFGSPRVFVQVPFSLDTMFFQRIRQHVNR
jgi:hypothetical protein